MKIDTKKLLFHTIVALLWCDLIIANSESFCEDDSEKLDFCSLLAKLIASGEPHKCNYKLEGRGVIDYLGDRDCKQTCGMCLKSRSFENDNEHKAPEFHSITDITMNYVSLRAPSNIPSLNPTPISFTMSSSPSLLPTVIPSLMKSDKSSLTKSASPTDNSTPITFTMSSSPSLLPTAVPPLMKSSKPNIIKSTLPTNTVCKEKVEDVEFCSEIARLLVRGKNRCHKLKFDKETGIVRQGSINCPVTCGTCLSLESNKINEKDFTAISSSPLSLPTDAPSDTPTYVSLTQFPSMAPSTCSNHELKALDSVDFFKGDFICSPNGRFMFGLDESGDVVTIDKSSWETIWSLGTNLQSMSTYLTFQTDGNLVLYRSKNDHVWESDSSNKGADLLFINNFGDVIIGSDKGQVLWSTESNVANGCSGYQFLLRGSYLKPGQLLCSENEHTKFGLDYYGDFGLWEKGIKVWSADTGEGVLVNSIDSYWVFDYYAGLTVYNFGERVWWYDPDDDDYIDTYMIMTENGEAMITSIFDEDPTWTSGSTKCSRIMKSGTRMYEGQYICSRDDSFHFGLENGDLCLTYHGHKVWSSGVSSGYHVVMQRADGNLVVRDSLKNSIWDSNTDDSDNKKSVVVMQDDGRVLLINRDNDIVWWIGPESDLLNVTYPSTSPTVSSTASPDINGEAIDQNSSYLPGELTVYENGLLLSTGLSSKIIATSYEAVPLQLGKNSSEEFHFRPDGASVFPLDNGWVYVSNSEANLDDHGTDGGVGALYFNDYGEVISYERILRGTRNNCSGGKSPWSTWLSCEEFEDGVIYEVDPIQQNPPNQTIIGGIGGKFESVAYDIRQFPVIQFFVTEDDAYGATRRFIPNTSVVEDAYNTKQFHRILTEDGEIDYLVLEPLSNMHGNFRFSTDLDSARKNANKYYRNCEGIDIRDNTMYMTCKAKKLLFIFDLDKGTYESSSTHSGAFEGQPDQIARLTNSESGIIYFCEDSSKVAAGVHGRDESGRYFTILEAIDYDSETTGLAFSPNKHHMYVAVQSKPGIIVDVIRTDGLSFDGATLDIKYHRNTLTESR